MHLQMIIDGVIPVQIYFLYFSRNTWRIDLLVVGTLCL